MPITPFSGVRSSWLTVATNIDFAFERLDGLVAREALASAASRTSRNAKHRRTATATMQHAGEHERQQVGPLEVVDDQHAEREQARARPA